MNNYSTKVFFNVIGIFVSLFVASVLSGTIIWLTYPSLFVIFPSLKELNIIATSPDWWQIVQFSWLFKTLFILPNSDLEKGIPTKKNDEKTNQDKRQILND